MLRKCLNLTFVIILINGLLHDYVKQVVELTVSYLKQCLKLKNINHVIRDKLEWMKRQYTRMIMEADVAIPVRM